MDSSSSCHRAAAAVGGGVRPNLLYTPEDATCLSEPLCILRAQIEAFAATPLDVQERARIGGTKNPPTVGQVGIRCIHCVHKAPGERARAAVSYPKSLRLVHQAVRNFQRFHFPVCDQIPAATKERFRGSRNDCVPSKKDSKAYWVDSCLLMGMIDANDDGGIRFASEISASDVELLLSASDEEDCAASPLASGEDVNVLDSNLTGEGLDALGGLKFSSPFAEHDLFADTSISEVGDFFTDACTGLSEDDDDDRPRPTKKIRSTTATPTTSPSPPPPSDDTSSMMSRIMSLWQTQQTIVRTQGTITETQQSIEQEISALNDSNWWDTLCSTGRWIMGALPIPLHLTIPEEARKVELGQLSEDEKNLIQADISGKGSESCGSLNFEELGVALSKMEEELERIPIEQKGELIEARERCPELTDVTWRYRFLRSEDFAPRAATKRMARYWRARVGVFGSEKAFLPITIENSLHAEDLPDFFYIPHRIVPTTDLHGRAVVFGEAWRSTFKYEHLRESYSREAMVRCTWYLINSIIMDNPEVAKNGVVVLFSFKDLKFGQGDWELRRAVITALACAPLKVRALHACRVDSGIKRWGLPTLMYLIGRMTRMRSIVHLGSDEDLRETLRGLGLPPDCLPTELGGNAIVDPMKWITDRKAVGL